jgi:hypothetical protein
MFVPKANGRIKLVCQWTHNANSVPQVNGPIKQHERWIHNAKSVPKASGRQPLA